MNDRIIIPREAHIDSRPIANHPAWFAVESKDGPTALIRCNCGELVGLADAHTISDQGEVNNSFLHNPDRGGCGWHVWLKLEGWGE